MNAIEQAIEALESAIRVYEASSPSVMTVERRQCVDAITALQSMQGEAEPFDDWPEYHYQAMGCGLEDRGITDRYEAMRYGWDQALDRVAERLDGYTHPKSAAVPEGYVLVPVEPTIEMIAAIGWNGDVDMAIGHAKISEEVAHAYKAMLTASGKGE
jgi:hypothetical protein